MTPITPAVEVHEPRLWSAGDTDAVEWWADFRSKFTPTGRITVSESFEDGDLVLVGMDGFNHALEWMEVAQHQGVPKDAMKLRRIP